MNKQRTNRSPRKVTPKVRFEVLKRDAFKCQYCGAAGDNTILHVDHIDPLATGGDNSLINLITSCAPCNFGKGATKLSDQTALEKQREQIENLQALVEQRELMVKWREGLKSIDDDTVRRLSEYWAKIVEPHQVAPSGQLDVRKWLKKHSVEEIIAAMEEAQKYLKFDRREKLTVDSVDCAWKKIGGICHIKGRIKAKPELEDLYKIQSILRNRFGNHGSFPALALQWMEAAYSWGVSVPQLKSIASDASDWNCFSDYIDDAIGVAKQRSEERANVETSRKVSIQLPSGSTGEELARLWIRFMGTEEEEYWFTHINSAFNKQWDFGDNSLNENWRHLRACVFEESGKIVDYAVTEHHRYSFAEEYEDSNVPPLEISSSDRQQLIYVLAASTLVPISYRNTFVLLPKETSAPTVISIMRLSADVFDSFSLREYRSRFSTMVSLIDGPIGPERIDIDDRIQFLLGLKAALSMDLKGQNLTGVSPMNVCS